MEHISKKSWDKRSWHKRFLIVSILLGIIIQVSVTISSSTALAVPRAGCVNPTQSNGGASASPVPATPGIIMINEVLSTAGSQWNCTTTESQGNTWIEIYNPQNQPFDLYATHVTLDQGAGTSSCELPFGSIIAAHGFLVVFPFANFSSPFSLIRLVISQVVIDQVSIPTLAPDTSYARIPDGSANWQITTFPTIDSSNTLDSITPTVKATKTASQATKTAKTKSTVSAATQTTKSKSTTTQGRSTSNDGANTDVSSTGVQPTWSALRLPMSRYNNTTTKYSSTNSSTSSAPSSGSSKLLSKILLTLLIVVLFLAPPGCWLLYKRYKSMQP
jgi:hypothetical protein